MKSRLFRAAPAITAGICLLWVGCSGPDKKEETTADDFLKKEKAKRQAQTEKKGADEVKVKAAADEKKRADEAKVKAAEEERRKAEEEKKKAAAAAAPAPAPTAAVASVPPPTGLVRSAMMAIRRSKYEQAIRQAKSALRRDEKYTPAMVVMARAYYHLSKYEFADSICGIALKIRPSIGECYNLLGFIALKSDDGPLATKNFEKATQVQPALGAPWLNLGAQHLKSKSYNKAITALSTAVQRMPNRAEAHLNLGSAYRGQSAIAKDPSMLVKAKQSYDQALKLRSTYPAAYFNLGILYLDAKQFPGMDMLQQLNTAVAHFNKYKQQTSYLSKDDPVDGYIKEAQKKYKREQKNRARAARRRARDAAKKAPKPAPKPAATPAPKPAAGGGG